MLETTDKKQSNGTNGHSSFKCTARDTEDQKNVDHRVQPESVMTELLENVPGARALYAFLASIFILIATCEEFKCYYNEDEKAKRLAFWTGQFSTVPHFFIIWFYMHMAVCLIVFPAGRLMRDKSLCAFTSITSILLIKYIVYHCCREFTRRGETLSSTMGVALGCESTRLFMKIISYLAECTNHHTRSRVTFRNFIYFMFAPTLIYKNEYERTSGSIRWMKAIKYLLEFAFIMYMKGLWFKDYFQPMAQIISHCYVKNEPLTRDQLMRSLLICSLSAVIIYLTVAYGFLHFYMNSWAEFLRFSDRQFYKSWWTAKSPAQMMREWNLVVHHWLHRYIFISLSATLGKYVAIAAVFLTSGVYHDYVLFLTVGFFIPCFTILMVLTGTMVIVDPLIQSLNKKFPNFLFTVRNYWAMAQFGAIVTLVTFEYQARSFCPGPDAQSTLLDLTTLRFPQCLNFQ